MATLDQTPGEDTQKLGVPSNGTSAKDSHEVYLTCPNCGHKCLLTDPICSQCGVKFDDLLESQADDKTYVIAAKSVSGADGARMAAKVGAIPVKPVTLMLEIEEGQRVAVPQADIVVVGRGSGSDAEPRIDLNPFGAHEKGLSRRHIKIMRKNTLIYIADLGSANGTLLNGRRLMPNIERLLRDGDELQLGQLRLQVKYI